ncbi:MAG: hypothetical protein BRD33_01750 [Bacteroidetes bacterium QH_6_63_17]|nr:MAG: hypothetical protein BRD33_01750 [Bacteroidetes bacterium QH_6_63_17]
MTPPWCGTSPKSPIAQNVYSTQNAQLRAHEVYLTRRAQKEIEKLSHEAQDRVLDAIDDLMEDPATWQPKIERRPLRGRT